MTPSLFFRLSDIFQVDAVITELAFLKQNLLLLVSLTSIIFLF